MQTCKGYCKEYKALMPRYNNGMNKRCSICELFLHYPANKCPCCGTLLRLKERWKSVQ